MHAAWDFPNACYYFYKVGTALRGKIIYTCLCAGRQKHNLCRNRMSLFYSQQVNVDVWVGRKCKWDWQGSHWFNLGVSAGWHCQEEKNTGQFQSSTGNQIGEMLFLLMVWEKLLRLATKYFVSIQWELLTVTVCPYVFFRSVCTRFLLCWKILRVPVISQSLPFSASLHIFNLFSD